MYRQCSGLSSGISKLRWPLPSAGRCGHPLVSIPSISPSLASRTLNDSNNFQALKLSMISVRKATLGRSPTRGPWCNNSGLGQSLARPSSSWPRLPSRRSVPNCPQASHTPSTYRGLRETTMMMPPPEYQSISMQEPAAVTALPKFSLAVSIGIPRRRSRTAQGRSPQYLLVH